MRFMGEISIIRRHLLITAHLCLWLLAAGDPRSRVVSLTCATAVASDPPLFTSNIVSMMENLYSQVAARSYGTAVKGEGPDAAFGLAQCFGDLSSDDCQICFGTIRSELGTCNPRIEGVLYTDGCFGRAANYSFFNQFLRSNDTSICSNSSYSSDSQSFSSNVVKVVNLAASKALQSNGFAVSSVTDSGTEAYALAQCWQSLNMSLCRSCLDAAAESVVRCAPALEGRALFTGCYIRYSPVLFWNTNRMNAAHSGNNYTIWIVLGSCFGSLLITMEIVGLFIWKKRARHVDYYLDAHGGIPERIILSSLNFKYEHLKRATNNFSVSNKLGQGRYGTVYKAAFANGKEVAVKLLFLNAREHIDQFINEVQLLSIVRHKNLARMLGFSVDGPERLIVYEYYPNRSLDLSLFDANENKNLDWPQRAGIILGVAEGLYYLHEESETRVIHRDIKASNILLDDKYGAKLTDFGLARALKMEATHLTTGVAGTLGYMAPEYVVYGHLTEKADIYSFGVLVIEIVTRKRSNSLIGTHTGHLLLRQVWNHYTTNTLESVIDERIYRDDIRVEIVRMVQIGLLCVQANPRDRPTMGQVVELLRNETSEMHIELKDSPLFINVETLEAETVELETLRLLRLQLPSESISSGLSVESYMSGR